MRNQCELECELQEHAAATLADGAAKIREFCNWNKIADNLLLLKTHIASLPSLEPKSEIIA